MGRRSSIRPGERNRAMRVATKLANVVRELQLPRGSTRLLWLRGLALHLKSMRLRLRDLDQPNGQDAIAAIARALPLLEWRDLAQSRALALGAKWSFVVQRADAELYSPRRMTRGNARLATTSTTLTAPELSITRTI